MENPGPFATRDTALKYSEAMALLQNHNPETVRLCPAVKPLGGQMFLISSGNEETKLKDWMCDQYKWKVNNGVNSYPSRSKSPLVKKYYHKLSRQGTFTRHGWWLIDNPHLLLVHYIGNEAEYQPEPHGNAHDSSRPYVRTCPSVLKHISTSQKGPIATYQKEVTRQVQPELEAVLKPRNLRQVQNTQHQERQSRRLTHDDYYNMMLVAFELQDYVFQIVTYPHLMCFVGLKEILDDFNKLLEIDANSITCGYDTTFNLGDFYVTPFVFRHVVFKQSPIIPAAFMIHVRKLQTNHEQFLRQLLSHVPNLKTANIPIVTDRER